MPCIRLALLFLLVLPLAGQTTTKKKAKTPVVNQANYGVAEDRAAAEQGNAEAQFRLGVCYEAGLGVPQDYAEAARWYRKAAEHGNAKAQLGLGVCYLFEQGVPQDYTEAAKWYRKSADQGDAIHWSGTHLDGSLVQQYIRALGIYPVGSLVTPTNVNTVTPPS
jgi:tetratricopeptide (TPR) repeat protein